MADFQNGGFSKWRIFKMADFQNGGPVCWQARKIDGCPAVEAEDGVGGRTRSPSSWGLHPAYHNNCNLHEKCYNLKQIIHVSFSVTPTQCYTDHLCLFFMELMQTKKIFFVFLITRNYDIK